MRYIKYTYVDSKTGISVAKAPAINGPAFPAISGLEFVLARESQYPTDVPEFFGTCDDGADLTIDGFIAEYSQQEWEQLQADEIRARNPVPEEIEGWQAEVVMRLTPVDLEDEHSQNVWARVQDIITAMPDGPEKVTAQTVLQRGKLRRDSAMLSTLAPLVPLTDERIDTMFILGDKVEA